jgi:hypothetical protein
MQEKADLSRQGRLKTPGDKIRIPVGNASRHKRGHFCCACIHLKGGKVGTGMGPIAEWLSFGSTTSAPIVDAWFHVEDVRGSLRNDDRVAHVIFLEICKKLVVMTMVSRSAAEDLWAPRG